MIARVLRFVRLPLLLLLIFAVARFALGANGVPYAPRGNAMFSIVGLSFVSSFYFGALSRRIGGFGWGGTALVGYSIGLWAQVLIFVATWLSFADGHREPPTSGTGTPSTCRKGRWCRWRRQ